MRNCSHNGIFGRLLFTKRPKPQSLYTFPYVCLKINKYATKHLILIGIAIDMIYINNSTSFCIRSSYRCRTYLSTHFQLSRPTTIWMYFFLVTLTLSLSAERPQKLEIALSGWHCSSRLFILWRPLPHRTRTQVISMTCVLHRPERYLLRHRGKKELHTNIILQCNILHFVNFIYI